MVEVDSNTDWKEIPNFPGYKINKNAEVLSLRGILKPNINYLGVFYYNLVNGKLRKKVNATKLSKELFPEEIIKDEEYNKNIVKVFNYLQKLRYWFNYVDLEEKYYTYDDIVQNVIVIVMKQYKFFMDYPHKATHLKGLIRANISSLRYRELVHGEEFLLNNHCETESEEKLDLTPLFKILDEKRDTTTSLSQEKYDKKEILTFYLDGYEVKEIAEKLCMSYDTAKNQLYRIKKMLINHFKNQKRYN